MGGVGVVHRPEAGFVCEWGEPEELEAPSSERGVRRSPRATNEDAESLTPTPPRPDRRGPDLAPGPIDHWMTGEPTF
jgi:hypothetical protein